MQVGMYIAEGLRINIGDQYDELIGRLDSCGIKYEIPYDKTTGNKKTLILYMRSEGIELNVVDNIVVYIHASNAALNQLFKVEQGMQNADALKYIREKLADSFETEPRKIRVDQFNSRSYATVISIDNDDRKIRIHLDISLGNMIYISTLRILDEARVIE